MVDKPQKQGNSVKSIFNKKARTVKFQTKQNKTKPKDTKYSFGLTAKNTEVYWTLVANLNYCSLKILNFHFQV